MNRTHSMLLGIISGCWCCAWANSAPAPVVLESDHFRYTISPEGKNLSFISRATGSNYLKPGTVSPCALVRRQDREYPATSATLNDGRLSLRFEGAGVEARLRAETNASFVRLTVESVQPADIDALVFLNVPLTLEAKPTEPFAACAFSLNLMTRVDQLPVLQTELRASCHRKFGLVGAKAAIVATPMSGILAALKEVLLQADEMPLCRVAGPWAREVPFNHGSYLFNFGALVETNADDWIEMAKSLGVTQIDNHGGSAAFFRFGDFELNREKWPQGWDTFGKIVARLHAAGIGSIFHSYGFFIDKQAKYVTPVPDPRLDAFRTFTLAESIGTETNEILVNESPAGLSTVTGFFEYNSVVLHLGDELVTFGGISREPPWRFTGVKRGAFGTKAAAHAKGETARHLKECFGLFVPNPESTLFEEIAANHAEIINRCGFDGIYLDAIDGSSILRGGDECWYWADKFVFEIQKRLKRPAGMEMSAMWHHFWQYRTRWQAWDFPQRGHKRFVDLHAEAINGGLLLPLHLGWWNFQSFNPPQVEPTYPEVIEQLGARLIGWDAGISLAGAIDRERLRTVPLFRRAVDILRQCEQLRHAGTFDAQVKAQLRQPGTEYALVTNAAGQLSFKRSRSEAHVATPAEPWTLFWPVKNAFARQPLRLRVEALMSAANDDHPQGVVLADFSDPAAKSWTVSVAEGVQVLKNGTNPAQGKTLETLTITNAGRVPRNGAWVRLHQQFKPPLNLKEQPALGLWIEGDGLGEVIALRLESPHHLAYGAIADRYITVDFTGRRFFSLVETESARWNDFVWNDGKSLYNVYRETIDFGAVESMSVFLQNLPPGKEVQCRIGPVKALPMLKGTVQDPAITLNGTTIVFPVELTSGGWIEFNGLDDCALYSPQGDLLKRVTPRGVQPILQTAENTMQFSCATHPGPAPRVKVTVFSLGEELVNRSAAGENAAAKAPTAQRILFLGDSITYAGLYVEYFETFLRLQYPDWHGRVFNLGLPSETVSGLSEEGHAGGAFPRPDLHERLDRVLSRVKPDLVIACYGINDGIYLPFSDERFQRFQQGMKKLRTKVAAAGAPLIHLTPPTYDPGVGKNQAPTTFNYNDVLDRYSEWLLSQQTEGWAVVDIHGPMNRHLAEHRQNDPGYRLANDGVHPGEIGHWLMARPLILHFGGAAALASADSALPMLKSHPHGPEILKLVAQRQRILKDAWLTATGHQRPGMNQGLPLAEADRQTADLETQIRELVTLR